MLLKVGMAMMSAVLLLAAGAAAFVFVQSEEPVAAAAKVAEKKEAPQPTLRYREPRRVLPEEAQPTPEANVAEDTPQQAKPKPVVEAEPEPAPLPAGGTDWPMPTEEQVEVANQPRRYELTPGAAMGLTIKAIGIYNAPVYDSNSQRALDNGIMHRPETSWPWSGDTQRNVYLAGHRLGYPGTGSHLVFYNLDKLRNGDEILLTDRDGKRYRYRVIDSFLVGPNDSWVMGEVRGRDMVTLQTCTPIPTFEKRLVVRADRV